MTLESANIMFGRIFPEIPWTGGVNDSGVIKNVDFQDLQSTDAVFGALGNEAIIIM